MKSHIGVPHSQTQRAEIKQQLMYEDNVILAFYPGAALPLTAISG
jgi:hypothetical protein